MLPPSKLLLNCREVVDEVFSYVDSDDRPDAQSLRKQTLVNSALAGRELHEPAMDARWSHLEDLRPLIALVRINGICNDAMATAFLVSNAHSHMTRASYALAYRSCRRRRMRLTPKGSGIMPPASGTSMRSTQGFSPPRLGSSSATTIWVNLSYLGCGLRVSWSTRPSGRVSSFWFPVFYANCVS